MARPIGRLGVDRAGLRAELIPLAIVVAFAALTPLAIGLRPWNVVSGMFVTVYLASRLAEHLSRRS